MNIKVTAEDLAKAARVLTEKPVPVVLAGLTFERVGGDLWCGTHALDVLLRRRGAQWECTLHEKGTNAFIAHGPFGSRDLTVAAEWAAQRLS